MRANTCGCGRSHLTEQQARVLRLTAEGRDARAIARYLGLSARTVQEHLAVMRQRAGTHTTVELVARCYAAGILVAGCWPPSVSGRRCLAMR
jgi:DNA-binding CsgD family transcriptional regulator